MSQSWLSQRDANAAPRRSDLHESPLIAFYELTRACDLVCKHCRASAQSLPNSFGLSTEKSRHLIHQLTEFPRPPAHVLTGGDQLKRTDIYDLVAYAVKRRLEVAITPSATPLVTRDASARLRDACIARMANGLDGVDAQTHDAIRAVPGNSHAQEPDCAYVPASIQRLWKTGTTSVMAKEQGAEQWLNDSSMQA